MGTVTLAVTLLAALAPIVGAQANDSYVDYNVTANPDLTSVSSAIGQLNLSFPDCANGPLRNTLVCDKSATPHDRAAALVSMFTLEELVNNTGNTAPGVPRLGLPPYQVWNEALHGVYRAKFADEGDWSWTTSFPQPILTMAGLNRSMISTIGSMIATQGRAFNNDGRFGLDVYSPNINSFRSPIWGRGQETPGEDAHCLGAEYAYEYITSIQGGVDPERLKLVATAKHYAGYDIESYQNHSRLGNDIEITQQDLSGYFMAPFLSATKYAKTHSFMCSYNAVNGVPSCANSFLLQTILRDLWGFVEDGYVSSDCDSAFNVFNPHMYAANASDAAAYSVRAGTDIDCGSDYQFHLKASFAEGHISREEIERGVIRLYSNLVRLGYFDDESSQYRDLRWNDVVSTDARNISYEAAVEGTVLLKNDGTLPLGDSARKIALIGPYTNATTDLQGNYYGPAPYLISIRDAFESSHYEINWAHGTNISSQSNEGFKDAINAAKESDIVVFAGGINNEIESEALDRESIEWPGNQLELIDELSKVGKPLIVLQMGGGQVDSSSLKSNDNVNALIWGGYPSQSGGQALLDIISGKRAPAGRLVSTQYHADYIEEAYPLDTQLRPHGDHPGQTYMWYTGEPVYEFGHGLFYTTFEASQAGQSDSTYDILELISQSHPDDEYIERVPFHNFTVKVTNTGRTPSDYTAMAFMNTTAGPGPYPNKWLYSFDRVANLEPGSSTTMTFSARIRDVARVDEQGDHVIYPGNYEVALNNERSVVASFTLTGDPATIQKWPREKQQIPPYYA